MPGLIVGADPHQLGDECLGPDQTEDELEVVDVGDQDMAEATPPTFAIPAVRVMVRFAEEEEDDFASSVSDTSGCRSPPHMSARQDSPLVMAMAAERVGLPLPLPLPPKPVSRLRSGPLAGTGFRLAPVARYLAVCGGVVATATESESSGGRKGRYSEGAGPHGDLISRRVSPR